MSLKLRPALPKMFLYLLAGLMWSSVGLLLAHYAYTWTIILPGFEIAAILLFGVLLGLGIYWFGFSKLARKNIDRINTISRERVCLFAFQEWHAYPLVVVMISLGLFLRLYSSFPKPLLAIIYFGIGVGLFLASLHYYRRILLNHTSENALSL